MQLELRSDLRGIVENRVSIEKENQEQSQNPAG